MVSTDLESGQIIRIFDYSPNPRALLSRMSSPIADFASAALFPVIHVRRGWLHGSHAVVTVRPPAGHPVPPASRDVRGLAAAIGAAAADLDGTPPAQAHYLATAAELGRWENTPGPYLPLRPQGHIEVGAYSPPAGWPDGLVLARDLMLSRLLLPALAAATVITGGVAGYALRVLALAAAAHPGGIEFGTLSYRSHSEAMFSWKAGQVDLRKEFRSRLAADGGDFAAALADPVGSAASGQAASLRQWDAAVHQCWGIGTALALSGQISREALNLAGRIQEPPVLLRSSSRSAFHDQLSSDGFDENLLYWHLAHRLVLNVLYQSLSCLGLTPLRRYYLCYGLSEATDRLLGQSWSDRLAGYAATRAATSARAAATTASVG